MGAPPKKPLLTCRDADVDALTRATARAKAGRFAVVEVSGEPGMGKSQVLAEAGRIARDAGLGVRSGQGSRLEQGVPLALFGDVLGDATGPLGDLAERVDRCSTVRRHLTDSGTPLALLLDDVHWADRFSLELIEYLIRHPPEGAVLMVVGFRDARPPAGVVDAISRAGEAAWRIRLGPLREQDLPSLAPNCADRRRGLLMRASKGNPRYLRMLAELPDATLGEMVRHGGDFDPDRHDEQAHAVVHQLTAELAMLPATVRRVAQAIAISGDHAALDLVARVAQLPVAQVVAAMDELCGTGLGTMDGAWFTFQHPLLCAAARATAGPAWRTRAHARAAEYLTAHDGPPRLLAHHLERSAQYGDESAAEILLHAGESLVCRAPATAVRLLGKASRILPHNLEPAGALRYARSLVLAGELDRGWDVLQELLRDGHPLRAEAAAVGVEIARLKGDLDTATALLGAPSQPAALLQRAALAALRDDVVATAEHARQALRQRDGQRPVLVAGAEALRAWAALRAGQVADARAHAVAAAHLVDGLSTITLVSHVELIGLLAEVETRLGSTATAAKHLARAYEVIDQTGQRSALPHILVVDAALQTRLGRLPGALDLTEQAASAAERMGSPELSALAEAVRVRPLLWARGPAAAVDLARGLDESGRPQTLASHWIARLDLAIAYVAAEDPDPALALLAGPDETWPADPLTRVLRLGGLAQARALAGDLDAAARAADDAELVALASDLDYEIGLAWYAQAQVAARAGRSGHAGELAAQSASRFAACGAALEEARARHLAALCAETGHPARAHAELGLAKAGYAACGADWPLSEATRDQRRIAARNIRRRSAVDATTMLTVRERQIADLVAGGLTNQQIADRLFLSRRTVESHLSRIFPKLAVRSRVAMARRLGRDGDAAVGLPAQRSAE
ncbi:LuxR C-terminal-related transcriptional regulator [Actinophytocola sp.]|uniref:LuxR C-terminal-related transcriptional regulator n=1 Tax=Actinophytocola sp. TaxID=1872138 RepID=UPI002ED46E47